MDPLTGWGHTARVWNSLAGDPQKEVSEDEDDAGHPVSACRKGNGETTGETRREGAGGTLRTSCPPLAFQVLFPWETLI